MKIAHVNCLVSKRGLLGVEKKLAFQARAVDLLGLNMDMFYCGLKRLFPNEGVQFYSQGDGCLRQALSVGHRYSCISEHLDTSDYDFFVLRYSGADFSYLSKFFRNNAWKIITEHHTKELPEAYTYETTVPQKMLTLFMERYLGPKMIRKCAGLIGVTNEIKRYELSRAGISMRACTIPNGVLVEEIPFSGHAQYDGRVLNLLFLANRFETWQGLDRVLVGLQNYVSRKPRLHVSVVGSVSQRDRALCSQLDHHPRVKVSFLGRLYGDELEEAFQQCHVAFTSLALFRKGMEEACALKTREYTARGLPFVIGHHDPDLEGVDDFCLPIPPDDTPVDMDQVVEFAECVLKRNDTPELMREFAQRRLDWKIKMRQMWNFVESVFQKKNNVTR
jgi:glycosyltransferase involved in cell wall biosynthesis